MKLDRDHYGKLVLIGTSIMMWLLILILFRDLGYGPTWRLWRIPSSPLPFLDFRLIPGSAESFVEGYEPSVENPHDPDGRIFNYPAFWRLFFYTGISQSDTVWISISMIVLFFISVFLVPEKLSVFGAIAMLFVLFSPASILLYERGNVDLFVFFICTMSVFATSYSAYIATVLILFASIMKLYPILGLSVLLKEPKKKFLWLSAGSVLMLLIYMIATWESVKASWKLTLRGNELSYGTNILVTRYGRQITQVLSQWLNPSHIQMLLNYGMLVVALVLLLMVMLLGLRDREQISALAERNLAGFRMGASIYVGTFLLGNNWDYRLVFLVLMVPQLVEWMFYPKKSIESLLG